VLGDFDDVRLVHDGHETRFFRREDRLFVETTDVQGAPAEFEVLYSIGVDPLQQYLVAFPGGRLQALPFAWDREGERWFHLYPDSRLAPDDALHWTGRYQNWNGMCAECHSTHLEKR